MPSRIPIYSKVYEWEVSYLRKRIFPCFMYFTFNGLMPLRFKNCLSFLWDAVAIYLNSFGRCPPGYRSIPRFLCGKSVVYGKGFFHGIKKSCRKTAALVRSSAGFAGCNNYLKVPRTALPAIQECKSPPHDSAFHAPVVLSDISRFRTSCFAFDIACRAKCQCILSCKHDVCIATCHWTFPIKK